ncbi:MAG: hypothetical protein ACTSW1_05765 [Candidatus Hodarchaeales archaeon]
MIELKVSGFDIKEKLLSHVKSKNNMKFSRSYQTKNGEVFILISESYAFRTSSDLTSTIVLEFIDKSEAICTIIASGGAEGICRIDWGAQRANEVSIATNITQYAEYEGWTVKEILY